MITNDMVKECILRIESNDAYDETFKLEIMILSAYVKQNEVIDKAKETLNGVHGIGGLHVPVPVKERLLGLYREFFKDFDEDHLSIEAWDKLYDNIVDTEKEVKKYESDQKR